MSYFGAAPTGNFISTASQRVTSSTNNYVDLDHAISALSDVIVLVNSVKQDITNLTFTSASRITLGGTLVSSDVVEIVYLGKSVATQTPGTGTVTLDMLSATGTKSSSTFLRGDNTFASAGLSNWSESSGNLLPSNASYGVYLGVNSATASNLLDDYEEGTADVNFRIEGRGDSSVAGTRSSSYTKIGNRVWVRAYMNMTSTTGTSSGRQLQFFNLPFNSANLYSTTGSASLGGLESNADKFFQVMVDNNSNTGQIQEWDGIQGNNFSDHFDTSTVYLELTYQTS